MQLDIGGTVAKCLSCDSKEFASLRPYTAGRKDRLVCVRCWEEVFYEDLRSQIFKRAIAIRSAPITHRERSPIG